MKAALLVLVGVLALGMPAASAAPLRLAGADAPAFAQDERVIEIDRAADRVIDERYQDLPQVRSDDPVDFRERSERARRRRTESGWSSSPGGSGALGALMSWLVWGAIAVGAVLLVLLIVRELVRHRRDRVAKAQPTVAEEAVAPAVAALHRPLDDADQLAREGRFAEAIHVLLLRTFEELARAAEVKMSPSLTSREILARIPLRAGAHEALADLASVVELTWFGDDVPGEADWLRCRGRFDVFVAAYRGVKVAA